MPLAQYAGILYPEDIASLQHMFARLCSERGISPHSATAEQLAARLVELRRSGMVDEREMVDALAR